MLAAAMSAEPDRVIAAVRANSADLLAFLARRVDPAEDAADLLSEVLVVVWRRSSALPVNDAEVRPWMFGIARKMLVRHYRTTSRRHAVADRLRSLLSATDQAGFAALDARLDLRAAMRELAAVDRDIIGLVHWEGFSLAETSRIMRMKEATVRSRYHRARAKLRQVLTDTGLAAIDHSG